jgi:hypothetical protein
MFSYQVMAPVVRKKRAVLLVQLLLLIVGSATTCPPPVTCPVNTKVPPAVWMLKVSPVDSAPDPEDSPQDAVLRVPVAVTLGTVLPGRQVTVILKPTLARVPAGGKPMPTSRVVVPDPVHL